MPVPVLLGPLVAVGISIAELFVRAAVQYGRHRHRWQLFKRDILCVPAVARHCLADSDADVVVAVLAVQIDVKAVLPA